MTTWQQAQGQRMLEKLTEATGPLKVTLSGGGVSAASAIAGLVDQSYEVLGLVGIVAGLTVSVGGLLLQRAQIKAIRKREQREIEAHNARMKKLRGEE